MCVTSIKVVTESKNIVVSIVDFSYLGDRIDCCLSMLLFSNSLFSSLYPSMADSVSEQKSNLESSKASNKSNSLENYEKIRVVGKGAFGTAVLYKRRSDSQLVVLKEVSLSELSVAERQMALNEVQVLSVLHHPNIISYLGSFENDGLLVIELEYAEGGTLSQLLAEASGPLPEYQILEIFKQVVAALQYMHEHSILHRDLKTVNIFLTKDHMVKVGDFGISKVMNTKSQAQTVLGTPYYISPEMCEGKQYDEKSDMWALGCILYELACREKTFQGSNLPALVNKIMKGAYEPLPSIYSLGLKMLVSDLLQKDPSLRPPASVISTRVSKLYEKILSRSNNHHFNYKQQKTRSVLYQLSGQGPTFQMCPIRLPPKTRIINTAIGSAHCIALTADMLVYTWGEGKRGELGLECKPDWQEEPKLVESLVSKSIALVSAGSGFSAFVTDSGLVLTCGGGDRGSLGHGDWADQSLPRLIDKLLNVDVVDISCGNDHITCLTRDGKVFSWGMIASGMRICLPEILEMPGDFLPASVKCGPDVTGVVTSCGRLLVTGNNEDNRLGLDCCWPFFWQRKTRAEQLTLVRPLEKWKLSSVSFGRNHSALLTTDGQVITVGSGADRQLGHECQYRPAVVKKMLGRVVAKVECGPTFTLVSTDENALYFWGTRFTQGKEVIENSRISMSTIETQVVVEPQEVIALYCSEKQISEGLVATVNSIFTQWNCVFLLVDTTAPYKKLKKENLPKEKKQEEDFDTFGPVPDWIKEELAKATHDWPGNSGLFCQTGNH